MPEQFPPNILDVTVRDGSYQIYHSITPQMVANIAKGLAAAGIRYAEVSHGCGIGSKLQGMAGKADDEELMEAAKVAAPELKLSAFIPATDFAAALMPALIEYFDIGRVGVNVHQPELAEKILKKLKKYEKTASVQLMRTHRRSPEAVAQSAKTVEDLGADIVYVVDTFGSMMPREAADYVAAIRATCKLAVGFHGHNHLGMAVPNTMAAWQAGAAWLDGSLMGVGRDSGNTNLEALIALLQAQGMASELILEKLCETSRQVIAPVFETAPVARYPELMLSLAKLDYPNKEYLILMANSVHTPLSKFYGLLSDKMGDEVQISNLHVKAAIEELGHNFEELAASFEKQPPPGPPEPGTPEPCTPPLQK